MTVKEPLISLGEVICNSEDLEESSLAFRFLVRAKDVLAWKFELLQQPNQEHPAFAIRYRGHVYAYLNRCAHIPMEMDWNPGKFLSLDKQYLICATHDAHYLPDTGICTSGPCPKGSGLVKLTISEREGQVYLIA